MLRNVAAAAVIAAAAALLVTGGHSRARAAGAAGERFTNYVAPTGVQMTALDAQAVALRSARMAHPGGGLTLTTAHSTFARAHALLMDGAPSSADESGPAERAEEMRSSVWVTSVAAGAGGSFSPVAPVPRGRRGPSGGVMVVVTDAHTGFVKEEYVGPTAPDVGLLGTTETTTAGAVEAAVARSARRAQASVRATPRLGAILGRVRPGRVGWPVTLATVEGRRLGTRRTLAAGAETAAGAFAFRELEGRYVLSAPRCRRTKVHVRARATTNVVLSCAGG